MSFCVTKLDSTRNNTSHGRKDGFVTQAAASDFNLCINYIKIEQSDNVKYLGVHLDSKLSWKIHIEKLICKLSKVCGMGYKLRHYVRLSITPKLFYYAMFHSHLQYSLLNWDKASKSHYHQLVILQNNIIRACLDLSSIAPFNKLPVFRLFLVET